MSRQVRVPSPHTRSPGPGNTGFKRREAVQSTNTREGRAANREQRPRVLDDRWGPRQLCGRVWLHHGLGSRGCLDLACERMTVTFQELTPPLCIQE